MRIGTTCGAAALLAGLIAAAGCGSDVLVDGEGAGGTGATGTGTGNSGGYPTVTTSTTATSTTSTGAGGAEPCSLHADESGLAPAGLRFVNQSGQPIFLPAHCGLVRYELTRVGGVGESDPDWGFDPFCLQTCEDLQTEPQMMCDDCMPSSVVLWPGDELRVEWDGTGLLATGMPQSCWEMPTGSDACMQVVAAPEGDYHVAAIGYESCGTDCGCDEAGLCDGAATGLPAYATPLEFNFPTAAIHDVVFDVCAFGCPDEAS
jgi:hypothetical protein